MNKYFHIFGQETFVPFADTYLWQMTLFLIIYESMRQSMYLCSYLSIYLSNSTASVYGYVGKPEKVQQS